MCGPGSSVGIATGYGMDGPGIESRWGTRFFSAPVSIPALGPHPVSCTMSTESFSGGKERQGRDADPLPSSSAVGHERVELCLYSPYGPYGLYRTSVPVRGCTLPLPFLLHIEFCRFVGTRWELWLSLVSLSLSRSLALSLSLSWIPSHISYKLCSFQISQ